LDSAHDWLVRRQRRSDYIVIELYWFLSFLLIVFDIWALYNVPIIVSGVKNLLRSRRTKAKPSSPPKGELPFVSVVIPVKNEEKVIGRLLHALASLDYPADKKEVIIVNDASDDKTGAICWRIKAGNPAIRVFSRSASTTKAAALNFGVSKAKGEIVATFDADSAPEPDVLLNAARYFADPEVAAVQGRICSINAEENMLTRFLSYEGAVEYDLYMRGKDNLSLFVGLAGSCQFVRRSVLEKVGGWNERCLSEDMELSLRLTEQDYVTKYAPEIRTWEESPFSIKSLLGQRARWFRGNIENGIRFGRLLRKFSPRRLDAEMTLAGTFIIMLCMVNYLMAFWFVYVPPTFIMTAIAQFTSVFTIISLGAVGVTLACITRSFRLKSLMWLPFIYAYWGFQSLIASYALLQVVLRRPKRWAKTARSNFTAEAHPNLSLQER
jgi:cellulose synthase/poly-beta-1,6-N-acetylglucosamine synthase-like glycosyltransferase